MKVTLTSIELRNPFQFFGFSWLAMKTWGALKKSNHLAAKKSGFWTKHYTMSLWQEEADLKAYAYQGEHKEVMKQSRKYAREIRTYTYDADALPDWKTARELLATKGKVLTFR